MNLCRHGSGPNDTPNYSYPFSEISYQLHQRPTYRGASTSGGCIGLRGEREGIELAIRTSSVSTWTPLQLHYYDSESNATSSEIIRGHSVAVSGNTLESLTKQVYVCGDLLNTEDVQFRWMGTAHLDDDFLSVHNVWALSNVTANEVTANGINILFEDSFGDDVLK